MTSGPMGNRLTTAAPLLMVAMLAALTYWLDQIAQPAPIASDKASRHDPDYIVHMLSAVSMNETGATAYTLSADRMLHYPDDDTTLMTQPRLVSYSSEKPPVTITSNQAVVSSNGEHVHFRDNVRVTRAAHGKNTEMVMRTAYLHVIPDDKIAKTDRPVTITDAATTVTAVGLGFNSETHVMKLFSNVRGTYEPNNAPPR
jgi:lipopolysaccharide export system protein LptC